MTAIFLNLGPRKTGGELLPDAPFRAFVKFRTAYDERGGVAVLSLLDEHHRSVGTAIIDWKDMAVGKRPQGGKYFVGDGALDEIDLQPKSSLSDQEKSQLVIASMGKAEWACDRYDPTLSESQIQAHFKAWISDHLLQ